MIYNYELQGLLSRWRDPSITLSVSDCIHDLETLMNTQYQEEAAAMALMPSEEIQEYILDREADDYLSSMEAHEIWY